VRVLTTEHWATLPHASKYLASLGAEVIVVEPSARPSHDPRERATGPGGGLFNEGGRNKRFVTLNLTSPGGVELFKRLASICDVVADNFSPRVMANYGLDYEGLRKVKPDIIVLSMSGWGHRGPWYLYRSYACANEAACGLVHLSGFADGPPVRPGGTPFGDVIPALHAAWSVQVALEHRARTGEGAFIDMGMMEPCVSQLGEAVLNYSHTGESLGRMGNRDLNACPSGCYPCRGEDKWIAIATRTEEQWQALVRAMGDPAWSASGRFSTVESRREHQDELDGRIGEWTSSRDSMETMHLLQKAGVPAGAVLNVREIMTNEHLKYRRAYEVVQHHQPPEGAGNRLHLGPPWKLSRTPAETTSPAPTRLGRDNDYVYRDLLGLTQAEISALDADGTISAEMTGPPRQIYRDPGAFPPGDADFLKVLGLE
jgi:crotonobetainyl-CoA:carnitine CoA-transferase CaiB-like acyl-CoA transferase